MTWRATKHEELAMENGDGPSLGNAQLSVGSGASGKCRRPDCALPHITPTLTRLRLPLASVLFLIIAILQASGCGLWTLPMQRGSVQTDTTIKRSLGPEKTNSVDRVRASGVVLQGTVLQAQLDIDTHCDKSREETVQTILHFEDRLLDNTDHKPVSARTLWLLAALDLGVAAGGAAFGALCLNGAEFCRFENPNLNPQIPGWSAIGAAAPFAAAGIVDLVQLILNASGPYDRATEKREIVATAHERVCSTKPLAMAESVTALGRALPYGLDSSGHLDVDVAEAVGGGGRGGTVEILIGGRSIDGLAFPAIPAFESAVDQRCAKINAPAQHQFLFVREHAALSPTADDGGTATPISGPLQLAAYCVGPMWAIVEAGPGGDKTPGPIAYILTKSVETEIQHRNTLIREAQPLIRKARLAREHGDVTNALQVLNEIKPEARDAAFDSEWAACMAVQEAAAREARRVRDAWYAKNCNGEPLSMVDFFRANPYQVVGRCVRLEGLALNNFMSAMQGLYLDTNYQRLVVVTSAQGLQGGRGIGQLLGMVAVVLSDGRRPTVPNFMLLQQAP